MKTSLRLAFSAVAISFITLAASGKPLPFLTPAHAADAVGRLTLTRAVVQEALRLYPPAFTIVRMAKGADEIAGETVPAGSLVVMAPWILHRHRKRWVHPERFDPTRFVPDAPPIDRFTFWGLT